MTFIALIVGVLLGAAVGGALSNWAHDNMPKVSIMKPFRVTVLEGRTFVAVIKEVNFGLDGTFTGTFVDEKSARRENREG